MKPLRLSDSSIELLKWIALVLMTGDHVNKYLFNGSIDWLFYAGRLCLPIFVFVLTTNLARPGVFKGGAYPRTMKRLTLFGAIASVPFIALGDLSWGWWPLNVMFTLLIITIILTLIERGGAGNKIVAGLLFLVGSSVVEYFWPAVILGLAVWFYGKRPTWMALIVALLALVSLWLINQNWWALMALPLLLLVSRLELSIPRLRWVFYAYYPLHLAVIWLIRMSMNNAGSLFF